MALVAHAAAVDGPHGPLLLPTSLVAPRGEVTLVAGDPGPGLKTLSLALGGRVRLDGGEITYEGDGTARARRRHVCLVDTPEVSEPEPGLPVGVVVGEELALAGLPSRRRDVHAFLAERDAEDRADARWDTLRPHEHIAWLCDIAPRRRDIGAVVLTSPDRWGGDPHDWYAVAQGLAARELVVVVLATHNSIRVLGLDTGHELGVVS